MSEQTDPLDHLVQSVREMDERRRLLKRQNRRLKRWARANQIRLRTGGKKP